MGDIYLSHSRKGSVKKNHKYISRKMVNGKWVYIYPKDDSNIALRDAQNALKDNKRLSKIMDESYDEYFKADADITKYSNLGSKDYNYDKAADAMARKQKAYATNTQAEYDMNYNSKLAKLGYAYAHTTARNTARKVMSDPTYKQKITSAQRASQRRATDKYNKSEMGKYKNNKARKRETDARNAARKIMNSPGYKIKETYKKYKRVTQKNILKGKKKVAELLDRLQKKYKSKNRRK